MERRKLLLEPIDGRLEPRHERVWRGQPYPLGATWDGKGVNFAIFSEHATKVELCLFDSIDSNAPSRTIPLPDRTDLVFHGSIGGILMGVALIGGLLSSLAAFTSRTR